VRRDRGEKARRGGPRRGRIAPVRKDGSLLFWAIVTGAVGGFASGIFVGPPMAAVRPAGDIFLTALRMLIVPLVMASLAIGVSSLGDVRRAGRFGLTTIAYYLATTAAAVLLGMLLVNLIRPGEGMQPAGLALPEKLAGRTPTTWIDILKSFVSPNLIEAMAKMDILPLIVFSLAFGAVLTTLGEKARPVLAFFDGVNEAMMKMVRLLMWAAPVGIFALIAARLGEAGGGHAAWREVQSIGAYAGTVVSGLAIHGLLVLPLLLWLLGRRAPGAFARGMGPSLLTAFSTASSSATLPVTLYCATERNGVSKRSAEFVIPVGATINMDGTALYEAVAAIFIAQATGHDLSGTQMVLIFLTATLASIGAAGIPEAGLVTMLMVLTAVNLPLEGMGLILSIDWLLDRFRTTVNVWGDAVGSAVLDRIGGLPPEQG